MTEKIKHAEFELTYLCNLSCLHCFNPTHLKTNELSTDKVKEIVKEIKEAEINEVHFNGGEPLVRKDIYEILGYSTKIGLHTLLETNAVLLTKPEILKDMKGLLIRGSIDGPESIHNKIRVSNNSINVFKVAMRNLSEAKNWGVPVQITCSVNKLNCNSIYSMVEEVINYGIDDIRLRLTVPVGFATQNWSRLGGMNKADLDDLEEVCNKIKLDFPKITFDYSTITRPKPGLESRITINPDGKVKYYKFINFFAGDLRMEPLDKILLKLSSLELPKGSEKEIVDYLSNLGMTT